ncbi:MAG TPA: hypothetical protein VL576_01700 [Candidatus Paceibacterota bacterium]|jgi:hypothetical protein|nr:hypothetical protein [Candidatus Paceibacterota bacterium]
MEKFGKIEQSNEYNTEEIATSLKNRIDIETIPHFKMTIRRASDAFESALASEDIEEKKENLRIMENCENYLGEKYRDDKDQRNYIAALKQGIEYLETLTK